MSTNIQVRDVGTKGVIKDSTVWQAPLTYWTDCLNVRFNANSVSHAGVWKRQVPLDASIDPIMLMDYHVPDTESDDIYVVDKKTNKIFKVYMGNLMSAGQVATDGPVDALWTWTVLADVLYVNREDVQPQYLLPSKSQFAALGNMGSTTWTCKALRSYKDFLIALNVTTGGVNSDNEVKWSDATLAGQIPRNWGQDQSVSSLGGSSILASMRGPIIDGAELGDFFLIYGRDEVWRMDFIDNGTYPFTFSRCLSSGGVKSVNCVVEAGGYHYVLGRKDIYRTDGIQRESLSQGVLNDWFWNEEFKEQVDNPCFVAHYEQSCEVMFFYQSQSMSNSSTTGCNRALVFNYISNAWSIISAPNTTSAVQTLPFSKSQWDSLVGSWDSKTFEWDNAYSGSIPVLIGVSRTGDKSTMPSLVAYDAVNGPMYGEITSDINENPYLERVGIKLDSSQGGAVAVTNALQCQQVYPLISSNAPVSVSVGQSYYPSQEYTIVTDGLQFDPTNNWQVDTRANGRFLSLSFTFNYQYDFKISGYDVEITDGGSR